MTRLTPAVQAICISVPLLFAACSSGPGTPVIDSGPIPDAPWSAKCIEAMQHSDFDWINEEIFGKSCSAFTSCHQGNNPAGHLNLTATRSYDELVNVQSDSFGDWMIVKPCSLEESYLMVRMRCFSEADQFGDSCEHGPLDGGSLMPPNSRPICGPKIDAIRRWILNGAPEVGTENTCGTGPDAAIPDSGLPDAGLPDAAPPDAPVPDAGIPDAA